MMKNIRFEFQGALYDIQAEREGDILTLVKDGFSYQVNLAPGAAATISNQYVSAIPRSASSAVSAVPVAAPVTATPAATAPAPAAPAPAAPAPAGGSAEVAPITGTVKEIKVTVGQQVNAGDLVIIMEAMKMDIEVFAAVSGSVQSILVNPGDSVKEKQPLLNLA